MIRHARFLTVVAVAHLLCLSSPAQLAPSLLERASTGDATAMHLIGRAAAASGKSVEAFAWFNLAAEYGVETAEKSALFGALSPAQITEAARRTEEIRSTQLRGLPPPAKRPVALVVETTRPVVETPVASPSVTPAVAQPALDGQLEAQKARIASLEADLAAARAEVNDARKQSEEWSTRLEVSLTKANQERDALSAEVSTLRSDKQRAEESLAQLQTKPSLDGQVEAQKAQIAKLEIDLAAARTEARNAKAQSGEATTQLETALMKAGQEKDALSGEVAALRRDKLRAEEALAQMRAKPALDGQVEAQKAQIARLEADLVAAQTEARNAKAMSDEKTTQHEAALAKAGQEKETFSAEIASLRQDRLRAEEARDQIRVELSAVRSKMEADLAAAQTEARVAKQKAGEANRLEAALAQATRDRDTFAGEIATLRRDKQAAEESLAQMRARPSLDGKVKAQEAQIAKLEGDLATARKEVSDSKAQAGEATARLEAALAQANKERDTLSAEVSTLRQDKQRAEESLAQMRARPSLDGQVEAQKAQIAKLEADLAASRTGVAAAKDQFEETKAQLEAALAKAGQEKSALAAEIATLRQDRLHAEQARDQLRVDFAAARSKLETDLAAAQTEARVAKQKSGEATKLEEALAKAAQERDAQAEALNAQIARLEADLAAARSEGRSGSVRFGESVSQLDAALAKATQERNALSGELATLRGNNSSEIERLRGEVTRAEQTRTAALADREAAIRELTAEQIRNDNLVRELARARPGMLLASDSTPRAAPSRAPAPESLDVPAPTLPRVHTVDSGENLSTISLRYYGTPNRWREIFNANRDVMKDENQLVPGMKLRIP